ncbi:uncharacterized protein [Haliotis asinina]|uniref:uncharacterized protein n=1 Tax=Haliotis asinina TaxID=109174 RepID=UPI0035318636
MAEKIPFEIRKPPKIIRVCTVCKEYVKDKMYRSLESEPSELYRKYMTEIGIPATGHLCYPCVSKLNRLVKIDRDLSTLLDRLKQKRIHLMCELKMLSTGMDHVDADFTSSILGMAPLEVPQLEAPPPKKKKVVEEISTAHFSPILPKKPPVLVIQNPVPKLPQTVSLGKAPVIIQTVPGADTSSVPPTGTHQVKSKPRPVVPRPIQPSKPDVDLVSRNGKHNAHKPLQPTTQVKKELPKILPRPLQVCCDLGSTVLGSGKNGATLPVVSNVVVQTKVPVCHDVSAIPSSVIFQPGIQGPEIHGPETSEKGALVALPLSTDDKSSQTGFPLNSEVESLNSEYQNSSQQCQTQEEVCLKNGFERIVTESGDEYDIVKQEFSDSESCDTDEPVSEIEESSGRTDVNESSSQSFVIKQEPLKDFQTSVKYVSKNCLASHHEHMKDIGDTGDNGMSVFKTLDIKQARRSAFGTPEEHVPGGGVYCDTHVKQASDTGDCGESVSRSVVIKQERPSAFDTPEEHVPGGGVYCDTHVKQASDADDSGESVSQCVVIKQERPIAFDAPKEHVLGGGVYCDNPLKQANDTDDSRVSQSIVVKQERLSAFEHNSSSDWHNCEEQLEHSNGGCLSSQSGVIVKKELPDHANALENVTCPDSGANNLPEPISEHFVKQEVT